MWGRGFQQRQIEELAMLEAGRSQDPGGPMRRRGLGGLGALTLAGTAALAIFLGNAASAPGGPAASSSPRPSPSSIAPATAGVHTSATTPMPTTGS
jgi:hypothetical protein